MGVDYSDAHIDLVGFIYEQGQKVVWWALFMNREERKSYSSKVMISKYILPHGSCFTSWLFPNHLTITRMQFVSEMSAVAIIYIHTCF